MLEESSVSTLSDEPISLEEYKAQVDEALREYFVTDDVMEIL